MNNIEHDTVDKVYFFKVIMVVISFFSLAIGVVYDNTKDTQNELGIYKDVMFTKISSIEVSVGIIQANTQALKENFERLENASN